MGTDNGNNGFLEWIAANCMTAAKMLLLSFPQNAKIMKIYICSCMRRMGRVAGLMVGCGSGRHVARRGQAWCAWRMWRRHHCMARAASLLAIWNFILRIDEWRKCRKCRKWTVSATENSEKRERVNTIQHSVQIFTLKLHCCWLFVCYFLVSFWYVDQASCDCRFADIPRWNSMNTVIRSARWYARMSHALWQIY